MARAMIGGPSRDNGWTERPRAVRVVTVDGGKATAEDLVLDPAGATALFGPDVAALIFDDERPGDDLSFDAAVSRYGTAGADLIFQAAAGGTVAMNDGNHSTTPPLELAARVVS